MLITRAPAVEETARRTRLAPQKWRETYREALELYKNSVSLGKQEARTDISRFLRRCFLWAFDPFAVPSRTGCLF